MVVNLVVSCRMMQSALRGLGKIGKYGNISLSIFPVHVSLTYSSGTPLNVIMCVS